MDIVATSPDVDFKLDFSHYYTDDDEAVDRRRQDMMAIMDFHIGVSKGILWPFSPVAQMYQGEDPEYVAAQSTASGIETFLMLSALGGAESGAVTAARMKIVGPALRAAALPALPFAASYYGGGAYIDAIAKYEPEGNVHDKSSFWSSVGAAMAGAFGGMPDVGSY